MRAAGFIVTANAGSAMPRQTDIFAKGDEVDLLIEVKNRKRSIGIDDIDALRSRLNRVSTDIVGAIFTMSALTQGAIDSIESDRRREVLVFQREEIEQLRARTQNLKPLIDRKRNELRVHGKAWFGSGIRTEFIDVKLPPSAVEFSIAGETKPYFESKSKFSGAFYSLHIPDSGWGNVGGEGARLAIELTLNGIEDLRNIVGYLHQNFGLSSNGMFWIQQSESCWYGAGAENFLEAAKHWRKRYEQSQSHIFHHSEEFSYFDQFRDGWIEISSQQNIDWDLHNVSNSSFFHHSKIIIQLPGVPVDASPFVKLCQYTGNDWARFEYIGTRWTSRVRLKKELALDVRGIVLNREAFSGPADRRRVVVGLIARNPFYRKKSLPKELVKSEIAPLHQLNETELLICSLRDWLDGGDVVDYYILQGFEVTVGGVGIVVRPFGTWNKILRRARDR